MTSAPHKNTPASERPYLVDGEGDEQLASTEGHQGHAPFALFNYARLAPRLLERLARNPGSAASRAAQSIPEGPTGASA